MQRKWRGPLLRSLALAYIWAPGFLAERPSRYQRADACANGRAESLAADHAHIIDDLLRRVSSGSFGGNLTDSWHSFQSDLLRQNPVSSFRHKDGAKQSSVLAVDDEPPPDRKLRILVVSPISDGMMANTAANLRKLKANAVGDEFKLALFHYTRKSGSPPPLEGISPDDVVLQKAGPGCQVHFWKQLDGAGKADPSKFDYIWLLDGDLRMDYFSWDLYRHFVVNLAPLVSQPSILGSMPGHRSTDITTLMMKAPRYSHFVVACETHRSEEQAPLISTRLWPVIHDRMQHMSEHSDWGISAFWDTFALEAKKKCGTPGVLLVNASPLRHENCRDLSQKCLRQFTPAGCSDVTDRQGELLASALSEVCPRDASVWARLKPGCRSSDRSHLEEWVVPIPRAAT